MLLVGMGLIAAVVLWAMAIIVGVLPPPLLLVVLVIIGFAAWVHSVARND